jgi:aspartate racemase
MLSKPEPPTFGLIAGLGVGAGVFYYRSLVHGHLARGLSPNILMAHADVRRVLGHAAARETRELATYLSGLLHHLARGGAEIGTIPAFAPQICAQELAEMTPFPLINLLEVIVGEVERRRLQRVAIFGARVTVETNLFGRLQNVDVVAPTSGEVDLLTNIYVSIVEKEQASTGEYETLRALAHTLIDRERLDAILLAGTDLAFVFNPGNADFPHVDGARTHIDAIMNKLVP